MNTNRPKILIIIPAFNAAASLPELIAGLMSHCDAGDILIIDDGSTDNTAELARRLSCRVISLPANRGKGAALKTGFAVALQEGFDAVVTLDADLQHPPEYLPRFQDAYGRAELVIGRRAAAWHHMPAMRILSNTLTSLVVSIVGTTAIHDTQSGYRLITTTALRRLPLAADHYDLESELLLQAAHAGMSIAELPIPTVYGRSRSYINHLADTGRFLRQIWRRFWY